MAEATHPRPPRWITGSRHAAESDCSESVDSTALIRSNPPFVASRPYNRTLLDPHPRNPSRSFRSDPKVVRPRDSVDDRSEWRRRRRGDRSRRDEVAAGVQSLSGWRGADGQRPARPGVNLRRLDSGPNDHVCGWRRCGLVGVQSRHWRNAERDEPAVGTVAAVAHYRNATHLCRVRAARPRAHGDVGRGCGRSQRPLRCARARKPQPPYTGACLCPL